MKKLPNGLVVFNATPHPITFWEEGWEEPMTVDSDKVIDAVIKEIVYLEKDYGSSKVCFFKVNFVGNEAGQKIAEEALRSGANVVVGSVIAAQAYPGMVCALCFAPGYERTPDPAQRKYSASKFVIY